MLIPTPGDSADFDARVFDLPGTLPIVLPVCRRLKIAQVVDSLCPMNNGDHLTHGQIAEFVVLHLLQSHHRMPLYRLEQWADRKSMQVLYDHEPEHFNDDRVRRALDAIAPCIADIETTVVTEALAAYDIEASCIHWDLTHVNFAGAYEDSAIICKGYGAGKVNERQLQVSLHVTSEGGIPVRHQTLPGNVHQAPLASEMLRDLKQRLPSSNMIVVSDRAGISYDNVVAYRRGKGHFLGPLQITDKSHLDQLGAVLGEQFSPLAYRSMNKADDAYEGFATRITLKPQKRSEPIQVDALLVHGARLERQQKQQRDRHIAKTLERLAQINGYLNVRQYAKADYAAKQLDKAVRGELQAIVRYELSGNDGALQLRVWVDDEALQQAARTDGRYIIVYDLPGDPTPDEVFNLHRRQGVIEQRNRNLNSELTVHPVWLHDDRRIEALVLLFVLALMVYTILELCSERAGLDTEYYHKMTTREMMWIFAEARIRQLLVNGKVVHQQFEFTDEQEYVLRELGFPDPTRYLTQRLR
jgi:transposase